VKLKSDKGRGNRKAKRALT